VGRAALARYDSWTVEKAVAEGVETRGAPAETATALLVGSRRDQHGPREYYAGERRQ
jgi:hypothetical protein